MMVIIFFFYLGDTFLDSKLYSKPIPIDQKLNEDGN